MKLGFRKPSLKGRISARTSPKRFLRHNTGLKAHRGFGWFTNPKKATYNRIYNRTTKGCMTLPLLGLVFLCVVVVAVSSAFSQTATVIAENANLRGTPSQTGKVVDTVAQNTVVEVMKQRSTWFLVQTVDYVGWLHGNTIRLNSPLTISSVDDSGSRNMVPSQPMSPTPSPARVYSRPPASGRTYIRGPRGGCYYWNSNGNKTYVDRSLCG